MSRVPSPVLGRLWAVELRAAASSTQPAHRNAVGDGVPATAAHQLRDLRLDRVGRSLHAHRSSCAARDEEARTVED